MTEERHLDLLYLNAADIEALNLSSKEILDAVESSLIAQGEGKTVLEPRVHLEPDPAYQGHFNILREYVQPIGVAGVKVVSDYVNNYKLGLPSELAILTLLDPRNGAPIALIDASAITDMRTGALTALGAKYLARKDSKMLGNLGARGTSYWNVVLTDSIFHFDEIRVSSRRLESREAFGRKLRERLGDRIHVVDNSEDCLKEADIKVEATRLTAPAPLLRTAWVKPGDLVIPYGTISAVEDDLTDVMDKIVVDDWGQCKGGRFGSLRRHVDSGKLTEETLYGEIGEIVAGKKPGRENDQERILFWHRGLATNDISLGYAIYRKARELEIGTLLPYR